MKKLFVLFLPVFTLPALGSGINSTASSAPCTNTTLETYSGNTNLQADWQPNTINLRWYNNNTLMDVQTNANTCTYDDVLNVPSTAPTRVGYTFDGWTVRPQYDFATLNINDNATEIWGKGRKNDQYVCWHVVGLSNSRDTEECINNYFNDLNVNEWKVKFDWGTIYGNSYCSAKTGSTYDLKWNGPSTNYKSTKTELDVVNGDKQYCWCQTTGYQPTANNIMYGPSSASVASAYIYVGTYSTGSASDSAVSCAHFCPYSCSYYMRAYADFKRVAFGITQ